MNTSDSVLLFIKKIFEHFKNIIGKAFQKFSEEKEGCGLEDGNPAYIHGSTKG